MLHQRAEPPLTLDSPDAAQRFFASCFAELDPGCEHLWVAHLDRRGRCIHLTRHEGDATGADFPLRSIVADAAIHASAGILLAHNHPSGDPTPSAADRLLTGQLAVVVGALGCDLIDHWIFARAECRSFRAMRLL